MEFTVEDQKSGVIALPGHEADEQGRPVVAVTPFYDGLHGEFYARLIEFPFKGERLDEYGKEFEVFVVVQPALIADRPQIGKGLSIKPSWQV